MARLGDAGHARVGWAERLAETDAPVGADASGYAYCDVGGEKVHAGRREPYGEAFVAGDVVGCYLEVTRGEATRDAADAEEADAAAPAAAADSARSEGAAPVSVDGAPIPREAPEGEGSRDPDGARARGRRGAARDGDGVRERDAPRRRRGKKRRRGSRRPPRRFLPQRGVAGARRSSRPTARRSPLAARSIRPCRFTRTARWASTKTRRWRSTLGRRSCSRFRHSETRRRRARCATRRGSERRRAKRRSDANRHRGASTVRYAYNIPTARATSASWFSSPRLWPRPA